MKGQISPELEKILKDPEARKQLREFLVTGKDGELSSHGERFRVSVGADVLKAIPKADKEKSG